MPATTLVHPLAQKLSLVTVDVLVLRWDNAL